MAEPTNSQLNRIGEEIADMAYDAFVACGAEDDFCIQSIGMNVIVFGGTNRLILDRWGLRPSRSHCTSRFLASWDRYYSTKPAGS